MNSVEERLLSLEFKVELHDKNIENMSGVITSLRDTLTKLEKTFTQVKWVLVGVLLSVLAGEIGATHLIKVIIGL